MQRLLLCAHTHLQKNTLVPEKSMVSQNMEELGPLKRADKKAHNISTFQRHITQEGLKCCWLGLSIEVSISKPQPPMHTSSRFFL